jgi:hypothetical protein
MCAHTTTVLDTANISARPANPTGGGPSSSSCGLVVVVDVDVVDDDDDDDGNDASYSSRSWRGETQSMRARGPCRSVPQRKVSNRVWAWHQWL